MRELSKMLLGICILLFSLQCQTVQEKIQWWWDDLRGVAPEKKPLSPEMVESEDRKRQYDRYEDDMDPYRVLRD